MLPKNVLTALKDSRSNVIELATIAADARDLKSRIEWESRRAFLDELILLFTKMKEGYRPQKRVFISYNVRTGGLLFGNIKKELEGSGFEVLTGFQESEGDQGNVLERVMRQLKKSTIFLGIFTKDTEVIGEKGEHQWAPSVWSIEEKGMALALGKPFVIMIEEGIHQIFWSKTTPHKVHYLFNSSNITDVCHTIIQVVNDRYSDILLEYLKRNPT